MRDERQGTRDKEHEGRFESACKPKSISKGKSQKENLSKCRSGN